MAKKLGSETAVAAIKVSTYDLEAGSELQSCADATSLSWQQQPQVIADMVLILGLLCSSLALFFLWPAPVDGSNDHADRLLALAGTIAATIAAALFYGFKIARNQPICGLMHERRAHPYLTAGLTAAFGALATFWAFSLGQDGARFLSAWLLIVNGSMALYMLFHLARMAN